MAAGFRANETATTGMSKDCDDFMTKVLSEWRLPLCLDQDPKRISTSRPWSRPSAGRACGSRFLDASSTFAVQAEAAAHACWTAVISRGVGAVG